MPAHTVAPLRCPHCAQSLPPPVALRTLEAARIIRAQPGEQGTSEEVAAALGITRRAASGLLVRAARAGLVRVVGSQANRSGHGARAKVYAAQAVIGAYERAR